MDKKLKRALCEAYRAPAPQKKKTFLKRHRRRELGGPELLILQIRYIAWWVWGLSLVFFILALLAARRAERPDPWHVTAFVPFLAVLVSMESGRPRFCRMEELELACRIPLQSVLLARMTALGLFHFGLLGALTPALSMRGGAGLARTGVYLLTPYLLTAALGMELTRRLRGREGLIACGSAAALVSVSGMFVYGARPALYEAECLPLWLAALAAVGVFAIAELFWSVKGMGELQWS